MHSFTQIKLANRIECNAINESSSTTANSIDTVTNSRRVWFDYLDNLRQYVGNLPAACYITFTALHLQTSS